MHGLPGNTRQRHLAGEMENDDVAAFRHDRIRKLVSGNSPTTFDPPSDFIFAPEPTKLFVENPKPHRVAPMRPTC